jgi:hypothetical protein
MNIYSNLSKEEALIEIKAEEKKIAFSPKDSEIRIKAIENLNLLLEALGSVERGKQFHEANYFHCVLDGKSWRRNGKTKTWKRNATKFQIPVKHGLYDYGYITDENFNLFVIVH